MTEITSRLSKHVGAAALFAFTSVVMTWPLARILDRAVSDPGDPFINVWILDWDYYATLHSPLSLFHANAFHPARYALAFSENLYGIALVLFPLRLAGVPPLPAYNIAILLGFASSGFAAYLLALRLTGSFAAAMAAGVFYGFVPFRFTHLAHVQHVWGAWTPLLLLALVSYVDRPDWRRASTAGAVFIANALTNIHWLLFGTFVTAVSAGLFHAAGFRNWRKLGTAVGLATVVLVPFLYPYTAASRLYGMTRSWDETKRFSARFSNWLVAGEGSRFYEALADASIDPELRLFPGFLAILLSVIGGIAVRYFARGAVLGVTWVLVGIIGSLGLNFHFHQFLFDAVPGFQAIRAPARWGGVAYVGMSMLIGVSIAVAGRWRSWIGAAVSVLFLLELRVMPIRWYLAHPDPPPVYTWLANKPSVGAVLELPINYGGSEYRYLLRAVHHHKRVLNGISGFTPPFTSDITEMLQSTPIPSRLIDELRKVGCDFVIVHADALGEHNAHNTREWLRKELDGRRLRFVRRFDSGLRGDWVFEVTNAPGPGNSHLAAFLDNRWTPNESTFGLMEPPPRRIFGAAVFSGFALSPFGVRKVDLLFDNASVRIGTDLIADRRLSALMPWYPQTPNPRFVARVAARPPHVEVRTDVQAEITDGLGRRTRLEHMWFSWE